MESEESKKSRILEYSFKKFTTLGISQVTMDDIARGVGIGKGTLYKFFPSKEELLLSTIEYFASKVENAIDEILSDEKMSTVEKLNLFLTTVAKRLSLINPSILTYLERSMPEAYEKMEKTRERIILHNLVRLFEHGKKSGIFDPQVDVNLISHILVGSINHITNSQVLDTMNYSFDRLFTSVVSIILKGCLTEEGRKISFPQSNDSNS
jgi:TetR/AcrR family transcriptional regulator, cholesterol catabolism regulator